MNNVSFTSGHIFSCKTNENGSIDNQKKVVRSFIGNFMHNIPNTEKVKIDSDFLELKHPDYTADVYKIVKEQGFLKKTKENILTLIALYNEKKNLLTIFSTTYDKYDNKIFFLQETAKNHSIPKSMLFDSGLNIETQNVKSDFYAKIKDEKAYNHLCKKMVKIVKRNLI